MIKLYLFIFILVLSGCVSFKSSESNLIGVWKSDKQKTLASMHSVEGITDKARRFFEGDFFGHLVAEYSVSGCRVYFDADEASIAGMDEFRPYELLKETEDEFVLKYFDEFESKEVVRSLNREGDCYYLPVSKWEFREYFCRQN